MRTSAAKSASIDGKPASLLLFSAPASSHALFNFLLERKHEAALSRPQIPVIYAPVAFLNAALKACVSCSLVE